MSHPFAIKAAFCDVISDDGEAEQDFAPCDPDEKVHQLRRNRFHRSGLGPALKRPECLLQVEHLALGVVSTRLASCVSPLTSAIVARSTMTDRPPARCS